MCVEILALIYCAQLCTSELPSTLHYLTTCSAAKHTPTQFTTITGSLRLHTSTYAVGKNVTIALRSSVQHRLLGHMKAGPKSWLCCSCQQCWINGWEENYHIHYTACLLCRPEMFHAWSLDTVLRRDGQQSEWLMGLGWVCWIEGIRPSSHTHTHGSSVLKTDVQQPNQTLPVQCRGAP